MEKTKYLYRYEKYGNGISRFTITRETESNIWINTQYTETKISKRTMTTGSGWDKFHYSHETPELLKDYTAQCLKNKFLKKLELLKTCKDEKIMQCVINIELPTN